MKSEKPKNTEIIKKVPKVVSSCETEIQLIYAQKYCHLAYKAYKNSIVLRVLGDQFLKAKREKLCV
jgi:hypothetical protein